MASYPVQSLGSNGRNADVGLKKQLAEAYALQASMKYQQQKTEVDQNRREEQAHLQRLKQLSEAEAARRREERLAQTQQEQMVIEFKRQQEEFKRQQAELEKQYERQLAEQYARREEEKERRYKEFYAQKDQEALKKQLIYTKEVARVENERKSEITNWQQRNETVYQRRLSEKEQREQQLKLQSQANINETLRAQIEEKERRKAQERAEFLAQQEEMNARVRANKEFEQRLAAERKAQQDQYREHLAMQSNIKSGVSDLASVQGRKSALRSNGASIIKPPITLDQNAGQFYAVTPIQGSASLAQPIDSYGRKGEPALSNSQLEANAKAFYGSFTPAGNARGGLTNDPGLEANARAFFGAYTPSVRGGRRANDPAPTQAPYDQLRLADPSLEANAKAFYGAYTPAANPQSSLDYGLPPKAQPAPLRNSYDLANPDSSQKALEENAKNFFGSSTPAVPYRAGNSQKDLEKVSVAQFFGVTPAASRGGFRLG